MTKLEIIKETIAYYTEDPIRRAINGISCSYHTEDGRKCAVGRCLYKKDNPPKDHPNALSFTYTNMKRGGEGIWEGDKQSMFKKKYRGHDVEFWQDIQGFHDSVLYWDTYAEGLSVSGNARAEELLKKYINK